VKTALTGTSTEVPAWLVNEGDTRTQKSLLP